jgi:hypothetical protein
MRELINIAGRLVDNKKNIPVIYVAGKVTNLPYNEVYAKFKVKQMELEAKGYYVLNPCDLIAADCEWEEAMRISVMALSSAHYIYLLPDWWQSEGAKLERALALKLRIPTIED